MPVLLVAGAVHALSFAPGPLPDWTLPFTQIAALAVLAFYVFSADSGRQAAWRGLVFGIVQFAVGVYWLTISMHEYGGLALPLAIAALLPFSAAMALYPALAAWVCRALCPPHAAGSGSVSRYVCNAALWASVRETFDYPVFVAAPKAVGITSTGETGEAVPNELPQLLEAYRSFQKWVEAGAKPEDTPGFLLPSAA